MRGYDSAAACASGPWPQRLDLYWWGWVFYNTEVLNKTESQNDAQKRQADYEKTYKRYDICRSRV